MRLIVGLGNPGPDYAATRHNIGFMAVEAIHARHGFTAWRSKFAAEIAEGLIGSEKVLLMKPQTFMNRSGRAVAEAVGIFKLPPEEVLVLHDEIDLAPAKVRVRAGGGAAGHNGIRSLIEAIGPDFRRVRLGIGRPADRGEVHNFVLQAFAKSDREWVESLCDAVAERTPLLLAGEDSRFMSDIAHAMQPQNRRRPEPTPPPASPPAPAAALAQQDPETRPPPASPFQKLASLLKGGDKS